MPVMGKLRNLVPKPRPCLNLVYTDSSSMSHPKPEGPVKRRGATMDWECRQADHELSMPAQCVVRTPKWEVPSGV